MAMNEAREQLMAISENVDEALQITITDRKQIAHVRRLIDLYAEASVALASALQRSEAARGSKP